VIRLGLGVAVNALLTVYKMAQAIGARRQQARERRRCQAELLRVRSNAMRLSHQLNAEAFAARQAMLEVARRELR
jgi:hypothetical protein